MVFRHTVTRRTFVGAVGTGAIATTAGCGLLGGGPATIKWSLGEVGEDPLTDENEHEIDHGSYFSDQIEVPAPSEITYEVEVLEGPNVNVFVLEEDEESAFEDNETFEAVEGSISLDVSYTEQPRLELEPGVYALIIYNGDDEPENA